MLRIGVIGAGVMGAGHALMLDAEVGGCVVAAVADADRARADALRARLGGASLAADGLSLIGDPAIDAVVVASPDATHFDLVMACIAAGKPVLCEKPLAESSEQCRAVVEAELRAGRRLVQVGFMRRFDPGYEALRAAVVEGGLGAPLFMHCVHRNAVAASYTTADMMILNTAVHEIDAARFVLGEDFADVSVRGAPASRLAPDRRPQFLVLATRSGVLVDVEVFVDAQYAYDVRAELVCESGTLALAQPFPAAVNADGGTGHRLHRDWIGRFEDAYRRELQAWVRAAAGGRPCGASAWDGLVATVTAEHCLQARRSGERIAIAPEPRPALYGA